MASTQGTQRLSAYSRKTSMRLQHTSTQNASGTSLLSALLYTTTFEPRHNLQSLADVRRHPAANNSTGKQPLQVAGLWMVYSSYPHTQTSRPQNYYKLSESLTPESAKTTYLPIASLAAAAPTHTTKPFATKSCHQLRKQAATQVPAATALLVFSTL